MHLKILRKLITRKCQIILQYGTVTSLVKHSNTERAFYANIFNHKFRKLCSYQQGNYKALITKNYTELKCHSNLQRHYYYRVE